MEFISLKFMIFFIIVFLINYKLLSFSRSIFLLIASYYFYWTLHPAYLILLIILTFLDYFFGIWFYKLRNKLNKKALFIMILLINIGVLLFFKYFNFFNDFIKTVCDFLNITYKVSSISFILPIGISYYVFKKISYLTDIYRGIIKPEKNFIYLALYISFFPEIIAGPIDRAKDLLYQFRNNIKVNIFQITEGLQMIGWGIFKKLVIADRVGILVDIVFANPDSFKGYIVFLSILFYSLQIYCDFSGYSDIAIGLGRILGFKLMDNFKHPYFAISISDFWKRWHISLSLWLRDYLFLPISYSIMKKIDKSSWILKKVELWAYILGTIITMLICGLWHGAKLTFVFWGFLHGVIIVFSLISKRIRKKITKKLKLKRIPKIRSLFQIVTTFLTVSFLWVFFRAETIEKGLIIIKRVFSNPINLTNELLTNTGTIGGLSYANFYISIISIMTLLIVELFTYKKKMYLILSKINIWMRWSIYFFIIFSVLIFGIYQKTEFIYGQF